MWSCDKSILWIATFLVNVILFAQGCTHTIVERRSRLTSEAIPAHRLPDALSARSKRNLVPVDWTRLRRQPVVEHVIGPDDVLGVYIEEVLPVNGNLPILLSTQEYPTTGQPVRVQSDGMLFLPLVGEVDVAGLTIPQAAERVRDVYVKKGILREDRLISIDLVRGRTVKVFVVRDDLGSAVGDVGATRQTSTSALDLPVFENDILHALSVSGGLPTESGYNEVWVIKGGHTSEARRAELIGNLQSIIEADEDVDIPSEFVRIPLQICPGQEMPFQPQDVIVEDGDVVFIQRRIEYFITGGLIDGGRFELPRDEDLDVLEALALAGKNTFGPVENSVGNNFRGGPGAIIPPTQVIIVRKLDSGEQVKIAVDLRAAMNDPKERVLIADRDLILLKYKAQEIAGNLALNVIGANFIFDGGLLRFN